MSIMLQSILVLALAVPPSAPVPTSGAAATPGVSGGFSAAASTAQRQLDEALAELAAVREQIAAETIPLSRQLTELEGELVNERLEYQRTVREFDTRTLDLTNLRNEIKARREESSYLANLLGEYIRNFESRLHIAEVQRHREALDAAKLAPENTNLSAHEVFERQASLLSVSLDRLLDALGGTRFDGTAVGGDGLVKPGTFVLVGPVAIFRSQDGRESGTAEQRLGSLEPTIVGFGEPANAASAAQLVSASEGTLPFDPTLGSAHKIESTEETLVEHVRKGGPVMIPILGMAALALLVALYKWFRLALLRRPSQRRFRALLEAVRRHDRAAAVTEARRVGGPTGRMLVVGAEHLGEPRELIEEVMYENVLTTRLRLNRMLPFIAICAASAPLLGLLGTVTGIINTFKLITVFGSGDVKTLSSGISEALITTEFGLIVAIPSLLLHAYLSRKAKGIVDRMEMTAMAFLNQVARSAHAGDGPAPIDDASGGAQVGNPPRRGVAGAIAETRVEPLATAGAARVQLNPAPAP